MSLRSIDLYHIAVPLEKPIRHASHERTASDNLVVRVDAGRRHAATARACPARMSRARRSTRPSTRSAAIDVARRDSASRPIRRRSVGRLAALTVPENEDDPRGMAGNAARCALELALLDAYGRRFGSPVGRCYRGDLDGPRMADDPARPGALQRGDHRRGPPQGADLRLEDAALRLSSGQGEGRRRRSG